MTFVKSLRSGDVYELVEDRGNRLVVRGDGAEFDAPAKHFEVTDETPVHLQEKPKAKVFRDDSEVYGKVREARIQREYQQWDRDRRKH